MAAVRHYVQTHPSSRRRGRESALCAGSAADGGGGMDSWGLLLASEKKENEKEKNKNGEKEKEEEGEDDFRGEARKGKGRRNEVLPSEQLPSETESICRK